MSSVEDRARELLADVLDSTRDHCEGGKHVRNGGGGSVWVGTAIRAIAAALREQPEARGVVDGDLEQKYEVLRTLLRRDWKEVYIGTKKYQLTLTVNPDYMDRINQALTGERHG